MKLTSFQAGGTVTEKYYSKLDSLKWVFFYKEGENGMAKKYLIFYNKCYSEGEIAVGEKIKAVSGKIRIYYYDLYRFWKDDYSSSSDAYALKRSSVNGVSQGTVTMLFNSSDGLLFSCDGLFIFEKEQMDILPSGSSGRISFYNWSDYVKNGGVSNSPLTHLYQAYKRVFTSRNEVKACL